MRIAVGVATAGRPFMLRESLRRLSAQTRPPDIVVVSAPAAEDLEGVDRSGCLFVLGSRGLTAQRNAILGAAGHGDILVFFDDDFLPGATYLEILEAVFRSREEVVLVTGQVIADGITGPGFTVEDALGLLAADDGRPHDGGVHEIYNAYGCNMAVRLSAVRSGSILFDEELPLYGWLEDVDFSRRLASQGRIVRAMAARGVHLGIKGGRQTGVRLGYSQIANPVHLLRKGTYSWSRALFLVARNVVANAVRSLQPEPYVDRVGRLAGNLRALTDLATGRLHPKRVLAL